MLYDELLNNAQILYKDYLATRKNIDKLGEVIKAIEDFGTKESNA